MQHRMRTGIFNLIARSSRKRFSHTSALGTTQTIAMYLIIISTLFVVYVTQTDPSPHSTSFNSQPSGQISTTIINASEHSTNVSITHANLAVWTQSRWSDTNDKHSVILPYKQTLDIGIHGFIGNNLAHYYYGNIGPENHNRKPKFPCTRCDKNITSNSKAISCDICNN